MNKNITIDVLQLVKSTITRERGNEAYDKLKEKICGNSFDTIIINLTNSLMISLSFLDGLIINIKNNPELKEIKLYFIIKEYDTLKELQKVITLRDFKGYYKYEGEDNFKEIEKVKINSNIPSEVVKDKETMIQV